MEALDSEVPLPKPMKVAGIVYNLKKEQDSGVIDAEAEYDNIETVHAIRQALEEGGLRTELLEADEFLFDKLRRNSIDMVFNIAEGMSGRGREAQIPALLNMLGIPFTGSDETTLCLALDKALTKRLLATYHIRTPKYAVISSGRASCLSRLHYPIIIKPNAEGSSKGISDLSIVESPAALHELVERNLAMYEGDMLAEEYIEGREFTVGLLGNGSETRVFRPMEIVYECETQNSYHVYSYSVKQDFQRYVHYECPATLSCEIEREMMDAARKVYDILGCRDCARVDFRLASDGKIYFIEINPLPGLAPGYSDYPMLAAYCGLPYGELVRSV
ncbi:MAG: ATP-grasp domain-containing protein, partial [Oscillospiraceae bacterium]